MIRTELQVPRPQCHILYTCTGSPCLFPSWWNPASISPTSRGFDGGELLGNLDPPSLGQYLRIAGSFSDERKCDQSRLYFHFQSASRLLDLESLRLNMPLPRKLHQGCFWPWTLLQKNTLTFINSWKGKDKSLRTASLCEFLTVSSTSRMRHVASVVLPIAFNSTSGTNASMLSSQTCWGMVSSAFAKIVGISCSFPGTDGACFQLCVDKSIWSTHPVREEKKNNESWVTSTAPSPVTTTNADHSFNETGIWDQIGWLLHPTI